MRIGTSLVGGGALLLLAGAVDAASQIGYVDVQAVLVRSVAGVAARQRLEREKATMQNDVDARRTEVEQLREELEKKGMLLSAEARREKEEVLQRRVRDLRRLVDDLQKELQRKERAATQHMFQELTGVIERIGKEQGYLLILEKGGAGIIYGNPEVDITDSVIRAYDLEKAEAQQSERKENGQEEKGTKQD